MVVLIYLHNLPYQIDDNRVVGKISVVSVSSGQQGIRWNTDLRSQTTICEKHEIIRVENLVLYCNSKE